MTKDWINDMRHVFPNNWVNDIHHMHNKFGVRNWFEDNKKNKALMQAYLKFRLAMCQEELDERNWEPFDLVVLKTDIDKFLNSDEDIIKISNKILFQSEKVNYLENVVKIVNNRQWSIRSVIDWIKFTNGA